ncbi:hypothetical protein SAMN04515674_11030 [Pseudarcicella hirudinis]|uniref:Glycosyltransferase 2-like domain-containing protein n=1 Tax=Pseudarcicella hirudinis TaxID=1079859 RepID=A0A1I5VSS4_9BACT|nr:glycosyltransferase family 2 protein [Pseudarcicella hirudinis]SFQ10327.1 hypothetical protein SAMN04515674_11030 [Pseudarcicella hirudinis]
MLDIIIVNWNSGELLSKCIVSIFNSDLNDISLNIIIVDNASTDDSLLRIPKDKKIKIVYNEKNRGFGAACNQGVKAGNGKYILFLNPDAEVRKDTIANSLDFLQKNLKVTVLGCRQVDEFGNTLRTCANFISRSNYFNKLVGLSKVLPQIFPDYHMTGWDHNSSREVDHVMGSYYLITREKLVKLNSFDEQFFVYFEDLDLSYRVKKQGGIVYFNADIEIYHETGGTSKKVKAERLFYTLDSLLCYGKKHFSKFDYFILKCIVFGVEPFFRCFLHIINFNFRDIKMTFSGYKMLYLKRVFN